MSRLPLGQLQDSGDGKLDGWCWSPDRPSERAVVELLVNGHLTASFTAARFSEKLREQAVGDGFHAFSFPMSYGDEVSLGDIVVLEARERASQVLIGRVVRRRGEMHRGASETVARVAADVDDLGSALGRIGEPEKGGVLRELGLFLQTKGRAWPAAGRRPNERFELGACLELLHREPPVVFQHADRPRWVFVLIAEVCREALHTLRRLRPVLDATGGAVVVLDTGADPLTSLLPTRTRNAAYLREPSGERLANALNAAVLAHPAESVVIARGFDASASFRIAPAQHRSSSGVLLGPEPSRLLRSLKLPVAGRGELDHPTPGSVELVVSTAVLREAGGFEEQLGGSLAFLSLDLAMKADLLGAPIWLSSEGDPRAGIDALSLPTPRLFAERWLAM